MPQEIERISASMGIGEYLKNVVAIVCLWIVSSVMIFGLGA